MDLMAFLVERVRKCQKEALHLDHCKGTISGIKVRVSLGRNGSTEFHD